MVDVPAHRFSVKSLSLELPSNLFIALQPRTESVNPRVAVMLMDDGMIKRPNRGE